MSDEPTNTSRSDAPRTQPWRRPRYVWFPLGVVVSIAAWWVWQRSQANYQTLANVIAIVVGAGLISLWFSAYGGLPRSLGSKIIGAVWLTFGATWLLCQPVYNGDMGIVGWKLRFGTAADARLKEVGSRRRIEDWQTTPQDFPRFLGTGDWSEVKGVRLETDWQTHPPELVWRHEIGAGWSAFAIVGNYAFTQEQRAEQELVTCYRVDSGEPVWAHADVARFDPAGVGGLGGIGPRATPTVVGERVFTQGATGIVNCLDARTGEVIWSHDTIEETGATLITWAKSGSPLVVGEMVLVNVGAPSEVASGETAGKDESDGGPYHSSLIAYDLETGKIRWSAGARQTSYASPMITTLAGERQIVCVNEHQTTAHRVDDGKVLWEYDWPGDLDGTATCSQPVPVGNDRLFLSKGYGVGSSLIQVERNDAHRLHARSLWDPPVRQVMKTKFNNVVLRDGFAYGLDDVLMECLELETGRVKWKQRRRPEFGHGQIMLIGDVILVLSETGELALVEASPERYGELASVQALDPAEVTWNTPAFAPPYLLVRNAREAACYRLPLKD